MAITEKLAAVRERILSSAARAGRDPREIKLVAVTKTVGLPGIIEAINRGATILGESRVQEAEKKISNFKFQISNSKIEWHMIGHLQKNKAKYAVGLFDLIHTVDSVGLAEEIARQAAKAGKAQRVLVQVKLSGEEAKHGAAERDLMEALGKISAMKDLKLEGLMTIPPYFEDAGKARPYFRRLRELRDEGTRKGFELPELSMGMSNDFEVAIEEGATMVRIGSVIFGERDQ